MTLRAWDLSLDCGYGVMYGVIGWPVNGHKLVG